MPPKWMFALPTHQGCYHCFDTHFTALCPGRLPSCLQHNWACCISTCFQETRKNSSAFVTFFLSRSALSLSNWDLAGIEKVKKKKERKDYSLVFYKVCLINIPKNEICLFMQRLHNDGVQFLIPVTPWSIFSVLWSSHLFSPPFFYRCI